ncbi:MAG: SpoIIE family protein phosphatase [Planctomycetota bacterium]|jgi:sigma-B regulation protein RsbU (phosphoserine phosphatase)|nr:SpoIIE family protein phosphatase [Planctomycetota bacterium]MDP7248527.1 SpoIIE family protein phosphatase [Planctomycetota bacterium]
MKILIAEDAAIPRRLLKEHLEEFGHEVVATKDGAEAWEAFQKEHFPIVVSDWIMPNMDGIQLVRRIRETESNGYVYIIMLTAKSGKEDLIEGMEAGADDFITKPFEKDELRVRLHAGERVINLEQSLAERNRSLESANLRMKSDLDAAAKIQTAFLPSHPPDLHGTQFSWTFEPCDELAGDTLNIIKFDDETVAVYVLDVSGHGVPAALLSVTLSRTLSPNDPGSVLTRPGSTEIASPAEVATQLNERFSWDEATEQYFTMIYGTFNTRSREFTFVQAGHPSPILLPENGSPRTFETTGAPIGLIEASYTEHTITLGPSDRFYMYSDGIPEAGNSDGDQYGDDRLMRTLDLAKGIPLDDSIEFLLKNVRQWRGAAPAEDDISILAMELM